MNNRRGAHLVQSISMDDHDSQTGVSRYRGSGRPDPLSGLRRALRRPPPARRPRARRRHLELARARAAAARPRPADGDRPRRPRPVSPAAGRSTTVGANRRLLDRFINEVAGEPVVLVGNSMGGMISILEAAASPDQVRGAVLVDPALPRPLLVRGRRPGSRAVRSHGASADRRGGIRTTPVPVLARSTTSGRP